MYLLFTVVLILVFFLFLPVILFKLTPVKQHNFNHVKIVGHRGAAGLAPENTLASFQKALEVGVDIVELDIHLTKDDSIVVIHDNDVSRTTNGKGKVVSFTCENLQKLNAGTWFNAAFAREKIPTLREVLSFINGKATVLIEIKWPSKGIYKNLVPLLVQAIREHHAEEWVIVQSFEAAYLQQMKELAPDIQYHQLVFGKIFLLPVYLGKGLFTESYLRKEKVSSVNIFYLLGNKTFIDAMHSKKMFVYGYTINKPADMRKAAFIGMDGIITDFPDVAMKVLRNK